MKTVSAKQLKPGDIILIGQRLELVTSNDKLFYSAPIIEEYYSYEDEPLRRSSNWVGEIDYDEEVTLFDNIEEAILYIRSELNKLIEFYGI